MQSLPGVAAYSLDAIIVGNRPAIAATQQPTRVAIHPGEPVQLEGWAADSSSGLAAGGISAVVDGTKIVSGSYGGLRPDVVANLHHDAWGSTGFSIAIPTAGLAPGSHDVSLRISNSDGSGYYLIKERVILTVGRP